MGAGPFDGHGDGRRGVAQVETVVRRLHVIERRDRHARVADLSIDIRPQVGIVSIERHRVESRRQALGVRVLGQELEALVGAERITLAREHPRGVFAPALEGEYARGEREVSRQVLPPAPPQQLALVFVFRQRDARQLVATDRRRGQRRTDLPPPHPIGILLAGIGLLHLRPVGQQPSRFFIESGFLPLRELVQVIRPAADALYHRRGGTKLLTLARDPYLGFRGSVVFPHRVRDFGEIPRPIGRHDQITVRRSPGPDRREITGPIGETAFREHADDRLIQGRDAVVVELRGDGPEHGHLLGRHSEQLVVTLILLTHVAERVFGPPPIELVDRHEVGEIQHVDLLELARSAVFRRHGVDRNVDEGHDLRIPLPDTRRLDDDEVVTRRPARRDRIGETARKLRARAARRQRAHVDVRTVNRVHADAIAEKRTARPALRWIDGDDRDSELG